MSVPVSQWEWFGNAAHFICADRCQFHLATFVGNYVISTVGEMYATEKDRLAGKKTTLGAGDDSFYETYIFEWNGKRCACGCGLPGIVPTELDGSCRWATANEANQGHLAACRRYSESTA
jgi:hypothetical protein